ncbi:MAG TPA: LPS-assembly protein LptD [Arenicellales bacterium]|nr:LPS-assembly protein LptD [Arenicellales bacterium]
MRFRGPDNNNAEESGTVWTQSSFRLGLASVLVFLGVSGQAWGAQEVCKPDVISRPAPVEPGPEGPAIELEGDQVQSTGEDTVTLTGNATMKRGAQAMEGDELTYHRQSGEIEGKGNLTFYSAEGDRIEADYLRMHMETRIGEADNVKYRIAKRERRHTDPTQTYIRARGAAGKAYMEGHDVTRLQDVTYTTCNEGDDSVVLYADEITLDQGTGQGYAKNIKVEFKNVPIFYFPRLSFPISDERKTGFLFPSVGAQEGSGFVLATPFYWNLAPNYDFTLYPRLYTKRGFQFGGEFRYLTESMRGSLYGEVLPSDKEYDDETRSAVHFKHEQDFTQRLSGDIDAQHVSDEDYLDDFSNDIEISSATYLPQQARLRYNDDIWDLQARARAYQIIDPAIPETSEPYDSLPQITADADYEFSPYDIELEFEGEAVNYVQSSLEEGWRFDATPSIKKEFENVWGYVEPKFSVRHTSYFLDREPGLEEDLNRTLPVFSVDSGVFFERRTSWLDKPFIQTLEPRLFYVYIPEKNQDEFPNFDTGPINLNNFNNIYREYRFYGADRVGDTNQITTGLTSRMLDTETGNEWMSASIGMIHFLEDREVNLNPDEVLDDSNSDFLAEVQGRLTDSWRTYGYAQWDTKDSEIREGKFDLRYRQEARRYVDLSYRFSRDRLEQIRMDSVWRILPRWHLLFEDRYSLRDNENLETSVGLEYDGCCWRVRGFFQRRAEINNTYRNAIVFELELTGLANIRAGY